MPILLKTISPDLRPTPVLEPTQPILTETVVRRSLSTIAPVALSDVNPTAADYSYEEYVLDARVLAGQTDLQAARLMGDMVAVGANHAIFNGAQRLMVGPGLPRLTPQKLSAIEAQPGLPPEVTYQARWLRIPALHLQAVWLSATDPAQDRLFFDAPVPAGLTPFTHLPVSQALAVLQPMVQQLLEPIRRADMKT